MKKRLNLSMDEVLITEIKRIAKSENRSATNLIETVMKDYIKWVGVNSKK